MGNKYYTLKEVAERFRKTPQTVRRWIDEGRLEAVKVGGRILIPKEALQSLEQPIEPSGRLVKAGRNWGTATMSRRKFLIQTLKSIPVVLIPGAMILAAERSLERHDRRRERLQGRVQREEKARELFGELFGAPYEMRSFYEGTHPDNLAAGRVLAPVLGLYDSRPIPVPETSQIKILIEGDVVLIGGPNSTPLTMIAWEFDGPNARELDRDPNPVLPLRFYGVSNVNSPFLPSDHIGWQLETVGPVSTVNWPFIDTKREQLVLPQPNEKIDVREERAFLPYDNYLLVTKLPNFLSFNRQGHPSSWPQLVAFSGNNGVGTRAAELLLQSAGLEALEHVKAKLQGATAFQALFRAYDIELTEEGFHRFRKIEPLDWAIEPLAIDEQTYERAYRKAMYRMYQSTWCFQQDRDTF